MQWPKHDPVASFEQWLAERGRMLLAAGGPSLTLQQDDLPILGVLRSPALQGVRTLTLWNPTDAALAHLWKFSQLEELTLIGGRFGDASVRELIGLKRLKVLALPARVGFTTDKLRELRAGLPDCRITGAERCCDTPPPDPTPHAKTPVSPPSRPWWKFW